MSNCPCKHCTDRFTACHDVCSRFIAYNNDRLAKKAETDTIKRKERDYIDVKVGTIAMTKRKVKR